jgi:hypothetical protein
VRGLILLLAFCISGCATLPPRASLPEFRVAPAAYAGALQLTQRLTVVDVPEHATRAPQERQLDTLLQLDDATLRIAALALSQRVLTLSWDGRELQVQRHPLLPAEVDPARVLRDVALVFAPLAALQATLPPGWTLVELGNTRVLSQHGVDLLWVHYRAGRAEVEIDNRAERYRLRIESRGLEP